MKKQPAISEEERMLEQEERSAACRAIPSQRVNRLTAVTCMLTQRERRVIFQEMAKAETQAGLLRHSKRRELLRYAQYMGIPPFEANLIIAQVQHHEGQLDIPKVLTVDEIHAKMEEAGRYQSTLKKVILATAASMICHLSILNWLWG